MGATPDGRGQKTKELTKGSAQHDVCARKAEGWSVLGLPGAISRVRWVIVITQAIWGAKRPEVPSEASRGCP